MEKKATVLNLGLLVTALVLVLVLAVPVYAAGEPLITTKEVSIPEGSADGTSTTPGYLEAIDPQNSPLSFDIIGGDGEEVFELGAVTNPSIGRFLVELKVIDSGALDYETKTSFSLIVRATNNLVPPKTSEATITVIVVDQPDEPPVMKDQSFSTPENRPNGTVVGKLNFTDPDVNDTHTFTILSGNGTPGAFEIASNGNITVKNSAQLDFETNPLFVLTVKIEDSGDYVGNSDTAEISITVSNVNEKPIVNPQSFTIPENSPNTTVVGTIAATDPDEQPDSFKILSFTHTSGSMAFAVNSTSGQVTVINSALLDYEENPAPSFVVTVADQSGESATATITVNLTDVNDPPRVTGDGIADVIINQGTTSAQRNLYNAFEDDEDEDNELTFVIQNNSNPLMFSQTPTISGGILTLNFPADASGEATITIRATDTDGASVDDTFKVVINSAPQALGYDPIAVQEDPPNDTTINLYSGFKDAEEPSSALKYDVTGNTNSGLFSSVTIEKPNLIIKYAPDAHGQANITIRATDIAGLWAETVLSVKVNPVNDVPTTSGLPDVDVQEGASPTTINLFNYFDDKEDDSKQLTYTVVSNSNEGLFDSVVVNAQQATLTLAYKPFAHGEATLTVRATDKGTSGVPDSKLFVESSFKVTVGSVNDLPVVTSFSRTTDEDVAYVFKLSDFASNFSDPDDDALASIRIQSLPANGTLKLGENNVTVNQVIAAGEIDTLSFVPAPNWGGASTSFEWNGSDGSDYATAFATVTITVNPVNDKPTVTNIEKTGPEGVNIIFAATDFTGAFYDVDGDALAMIRIITLPANGTLRLSNAAVGVNDQISAGVLSQLRYVPDQFYNGTDGFKWAGSDGQIFSDSADVILNVTPENDAPTLDLNGGQSGVNFNATFVAGGPPVAITSQNLTISDVDSETMQSASVIIIGPKNGAKEVLSADVSGTAIMASFAMSGSNGVLQLDGPAPTADFVKVLKTVKYQITPDVTNPDTSERNIQFNVYDGEDNSNDAFARVDVINPRIEITVSPAIQPVARGGTAAFTINVKNVGTVDLKNLFITSENVPACNRSGEGFETLKVGMSLSPYVCLVPDVQGRIDNLVKVTATDVVANSIVTDDDTGVVRVPRQMAIDIAPVAGVGSVLVKGQDAQFVVTVVNPSEVDLTKVEVKAFVNYDLAVAIASPTENVPVPACDKTIGNLGAGKESKYNCTIPNVQQSFKIEVQVTGLIDELIETDDFDIETLSVLNLTLDAFSSPFEIPTGTATPVEYSMTLANPSTVPLTLTTLSSNLHGNLLDPANSAISDNSCTGLALAIPPGEVRSCSYTALVNAVPPVITNVLTATAEDEGARQVTVSDSAIVSIGDFAALEAHLTAAPNTLVAPGGTVNITVRVVNNTGSQLTLDTLTESKEGNLNGKGNCEVPQTIPGNGEYTCVYSVTVTGLTAGSTESRTVTARADSLQAIDRLDIPVTATSQLTIMLPSVSKMARAGEPNNGACSALAINTNQNNYFYADDSDDWYKFQVSAPGDVRVKLSNFLVTDGHLLIFSGACNTPSQVPNGHNGDVGMVLNRELDLSNLQVGTTYYIWVVARAGLDSSAPYNLYVETLP